jgi:hypothetical protein
MTPHIGSVSLYVDRHPLAVSMNASKTITASFTRKPSLTVEPPLDGLFEEGFRLSVIGECGTGYTILGSTNLIDWDSTGNSDQHIRHCRVHRSGSSKRPLSLLSGGIVLIGAGSPARSHPRAKPCVSACKWHRHDWPKHVPLTDQPLDKIASLRS